MPYLYPQCLRTEGKKDPRAVAAARQAIDKYGGTKEFLTKILA